jgi:nucleoside-diphosphate-sugar epimerase
LLELAFSKEAKEDVVNIGGDDEITILEFAKLVRELTNSSSEIEFLPLPKDDPTRRKPDITKAKMLLNWKPKIKLEEGLKRMIEWFKEKEEE